MNVEARTHRFLQQTKCLLLDLVSLLEIRNEEFLFLNDPDWSLIQAENKKNNIAKNITLFIKKSRIAMTAQLQDIFSVVLQLMRQNEKPIKNR